jgi:RNA polymerase sigma factor (sigma-70 family)
MHLYSIITNQKKTMKTFKNTTHEELIRAILQDDHHALGELYNRYYRKVFQKCLSFVKDHDEAFDLAQEALMKAFENLKSFRGDSSFSTWLYIITHRYCLGALRKRNRMIVKTSPVNFGGDESSDLIIASEEAVDLDEQEYIMFCLINKLPEAERELLMLKYSQGESIASLQSTLHLSSSAIKMRLKRTREKLNQLYLLASTIGLAEALAQL